MKADTYAAENMYDAWDNGDRHEIRRKFARREELIRMAREAGFCVEQIDTLDEVFAPDDSYYTQHPNVGYEVLTGILERFAALIAAQEREACEKEAQERIDRLYMMYEQACQQRDALMDQQRAQIEAMRGRIQ